MRYSSRVFPCNMIWGALCSGRIKRHLPIKVVRLMFAEVGMLYFGDGL